MGARTDDVNSEFSVGFFFLNFPAWDVAMFMREGIYKDACFKYTLVIPKDYPKGTTEPVKCNMRHA